MNPLQEKPNLFANGKFRVRWEDKTSRVIGCTWLRDDPDCWLLKMHIDDTESINEIYAPLKDCTLIARPIEDMTDEELISMPFIKRLFGNKYEANKPRDLQNYLSNKAEHGDLSFEDAMDLISKGVLAFPPSLFDDGTVIDSRTL